MSKTSSLSTSQRLVKHILLWIVFGYCYQSAVSLLIKMAADSQPANPLITALVYTLAFNILAAHLITKYDQYWPIIGSVFIGVVGLIAVPLLLIGESGLVSLSLLVGILFSLPLCCYIVGLIKVKVGKN